MQIYLFLYLKASEGWLLTVRLLLWKRCLLEFVQICLKNLGTIMWLRENTQPNTEVKQRKKDRRDAAETWQRAQTAAASQSDEHSCECVGKWAEIYGFSGGTTNVPLGDSFEVCVVFSERYSLSACNDPPPHLPRLFITLCCNISSCRSQHT